jgi:hypothetical protein
VTAAPAANAPHAGSWPARSLPQALLGYVLERRLAGLGAAAPEVAVTSPWDLWWVSFRVAAAAGQLGVAGRLPAASCAACAVNASELAAADPPRHPGSIGSQDCRCLLDWAIGMRSPGTPATWPALPLALALIKPGAPAGALRSALRRTHDIVQEREQDLAAADVLRLYPETYGAEFTEAVVAFLTSAPVRILVLRSRDGGRGDPAVLKRALRLELGTTDLMRNHLHMADNPAEALADICHLAGPEMLAGLYERHARDGAADRLAFYRTALGIGGPSPDRRP